MSDPPIRAINTETQMGTLLVVLSANDAKRLSRRSPLHRRDKDPFILK